jgi:hypothetical protein
MKKYIIAIALFYSVHSFGQQSAETTKQDIQQVVATYFNCIVTALRSAIFSLRTACLFMVSIPPKPTKHL